MRDNAKHSCGGPKFGMVLLAIFRSFCITSVGSLASLGGMVGGALGGGQVDAGMEFARTWRIAAAVVHDDSRGVHWPGQGLSRRHHRGRGKH